MPSTEEILDHHLGCFASCDVEATLSDYTESSVLLTPQGALRGLPAIRAFFETAYAELRQPGTQFRLQQKLVDGDCAFVAWEGETSVSTYEAASDTFVIRDGRIIVQTFAAKVTPKTPSMAHRVDIDAEYPGIGVA
jgi:hypothetical protein